MQLKLPSQEFSFSFSSLSLSDDQGLAVAYATALRIDVRPEGGPLGTNLVDTLLIDASELLHQLERRAAIDKEFAGLEPDAPSIQSSFLI